MSSFDKIGASFENTSFRTQRLKTLIGEGSEAGSCKGSAYGPHPISPIGGEKNLCFMG